MLPTLLMSVGKYIRERRAAAGLTLTGLSRALGVSIPYLSDVEHDNRRLATARWSQLVQIVDGIDLNTIASLAITEQPIEIDARYLSQSARDEFARAVVKALESVRDTSDAAHRVRVKGVNPTEPQICAEDLPPPPPKQEYDKPGLIIDIPPVDPTVANDGEFDLGDIPPPPKPLGDWRTALASIEYDSTTVEITRVNISGVVGQELGGQRWRTIHSAPDEASYAGTPQQTSEARMREAVMAALLDMAELLTVEAGYAATFKNVVYSALVHHVRMKFLNGSSIGLAEPKDVDFVWKMLPQVKAKVGAIPGLITGVIEHGVLIFSPQ